MTRNLKAVGLALAAVFAMSAVAASSAAAETAFHFTAPSGTSTLTGTDHVTSLDVLTTHSGEHACVKASYTGSISGPTASSITLAPAYAECHIIVLFTFKTTVDPEGCTFRFNAVTKTAIAYEGTVDILCAAGKVMKFTAPGCTITVGAQAGLKTAKYTSVGSGTTKEILIDLNLGGVKYTEDDSGLCENDGVLTNNGGYDGKILLTGEQGGSHISLGLGNT